jgi:membrane protein YqaA with SNARE-associated domain
LQFKQAHERLNLHPRTGRATIPASLLATLFAYAFLSNVALALVPHEPIVIGFGAVYGVWTTAFVATCGTVTAAWVDHRVFVPLITRVRDRALFATGAIGWLRRHFARAPFLVLTASSLLPLPAFPFKAMAFAERYPLVRYLAAVAAGRFPRYALLAWLGLLVHVPAWVLVALFALMLLPTVRVLWKPRRAS